MYVMLMIKVVLYIEVYLQNAGGALAVQAFSGFSINGEPVAGDQPDSIALIDSETGSLAVDINRQAVSTG